jgi:hypothetical protein
MLTLALLKGAAESMIIGVIVTVRHVIIRRCPRTRKRPHVPSRKKLPDLKGDVAGMKLIAVGRVLAFLDRDVAELLIVRHGGDDEDREGNQAVAAKMRRYHLQLDALKELDERSVTDVLLKKTDNFAEEVRLGLPVLGREPVLHRAIARELKECTHDEGRFLRFGEAHS